MPDVIPGTIFMRQAEMKGTICIDQVLKQCIMVSRMENRISGKIAIMYGGLYDEKKAIQQHQICR